MTRYFWLALFACASVAPACNHSPSGSVWHADRSGDDFCPPPCDRDEDGVLDTQDNCPDTPNPQQLDSDRDHRGDLCDREPTVTNYVLSKSSVQRTPQMSDGRFLLRTETKHTIHKSDDNEFQMTVELRP